MNLLHGIGFWIVLQNPYLAVLVFLDHYCQVWFCFHLCMAIDVICANTFSFVFAMDDNLRPVSLSIRIDLDTDVEEGVEAAIMFTVAMICYLFIYLFVK